MKNKLGKVSVAVGALTYLYMVVMTVQGTGEGLSLTTFGLWATLAWISSITILKQKADPSVPIVYGVGSSSTAIALLIKGRYLWSTLDTIVAVLVLVCAVLWLTSGPRWALIMSIVAGTIAGIPFVIMTWKNPEMSPVIANTGFLITNILALASAKAWTVEDRLYSSVNVVLCSLLVLPWLLQ